MIEGDKADQRWQAALAGCLVLGAALRLFFNDVHVFSNADETAYLIGARRLAGHFISRFPQFALDYANTPIHWDSPPPMRFGHWALISTACGFSSTCDHATLAWPSTISGIAALAFTWLLGRELLGSKAALVAVALSIASPLQLHLGRRALQDEIACAAVLAALWSVARALSIKPRNTPGAHLLAVLFCTLALAEKETALLWIPPLFALWALRHRARGWCKYDLVLLLPPFLFFAAFCALSHSFTLFFRDALGNLSTLEGAHYVAQYMSGPPYRYLLDLFIITPVPFLLGMAACGAVLVPGSQRSSSGITELAVIFWIACLVWIPTPKDLRYFAPADPLLALLAASFLLTFAERGRAAIALVALLLVLNLGGDLWLFRRIFLDRNVYDPTTFDLLKALDAIPR